ncbi:MAG: DUF6122 family protein [Flavobacteriaceae bacterium]|nr:DUF6122 family protein [Flavobacteriaceae bacterium]
MWIHLLHYFLHFFAIIAIAYCYQPKQWKLNYLILLATMLVDLDHLWASPIFDPNRCSIGTHTFHTPLFISVYVTTLVVVQNYHVKLIALGLVFHMITDAIDCFLNQTW